MEKRLSLGKVDYNGRGRKINEVTVKWELTEDGRFSMSGAIWNGRGTDWLAGGQNLEEILKLFPHNAQLRRMVAVWRRWHLNDMRAGTPIQEAFVKGYRSAPGKKYADYAEVCEALKAADLYEVDGYKYGSAWLREEIPADVRAEIESWSNVQQEATTCA